MTKEYTVDDIVSSAERQVVSIPWQDGEIEFRITPKSYGELSVIRKKVENFKGKGDTALSEELIRDAVEKKVIKGDKEEWKQMSKKDINKVPPGLIYKLTEKINEIEGIVVPENILQNL